MNSHALVTKIFFGTFCPENEFFATGFLGNTQIDFALFKKDLPYSCNIFLSFISASLLYYGIWEEDIVTNVLKTLELYQVKLVFLCHMICAPLGALKEAVKKWYFLGIIPQPVYPPRYIEE